MLKTAGSRGGDGEEIPAARDDISTFQADVADTQFWKHSHHGVYTVATGITSQICNNGDESLSHVFRECQNARQFWAANNFPPTFLSIFSLCYTDWVLLNLQDSSTLWRGLPWNSLFALCLWILWKTRCASIFNHTYELPSPKFNDIYLFYRDWLTANLCDFKSLLSFSPAHWQPPEVDTLKFNVDAGVLSNGMVSIAGVLRDYKGAWLIGFHQCLPSMTVLEAEFCGIQKSLSILMTSQFCKLPAVPCPVHGILLSICSARS